MSLVGIPDVACVLGAGSGTLDGLGSLCVWDGLILDFVGDLYRSTDFAVGKPYSFQALLAIRRTRISEVTRRAHTPLP